MGRDLSVRCRGLNGSQRILLHAFDQAEDYCEAVGGTGLSVCEKKEKAPYARCGGWGLNPGLRDGFSGY